MGTVLLVRVEGRVAGRGHTVVVVVLAESGGQRE